MKPYIKVAPDGPYLAFGIRDVSEKIIVADGNGISVEYADGEIFEVKSDPVALCRCGRSEGAPFCDGSHAKCGFDGTERASFDPIANGAESIEGPNLTLLDNPDYCAFARFCDAAGRVWNLVRIGAEDADKQAVKEANLCPAGRLIVLDKHGDVLEETLPPSIGLIEDPHLKISGPLWVRGGIRVESAGGKSYEIRMKQTLCRCGASSNKPFCNGAHASIRFKAAKPVK